MGGNVFGLMLAFGLHNKGFTRQLMELGCSRKDALALINSWWVAPHPMLSNLAPSQALKLGYSDEAIDEAFNNNLAALMAALDMRTIGVIEIIVIYEA